MSNNIYGDIKCPALMNDGRGNNTNFKPKNDYFEQLKNKMNSANLNEFKKDLTIFEVKSKMNECDNVPHGDINLNFETGSLLKTKGGSWKDNFKELKN